MNSEIIIGKDLTQSVMAELNKDNIFVITDETVYSLYPQLFSLSRKMVIPAGEDSKSLEMLGIITRKMLECGCNRKTTVIAIGGGVVGDLSGFVAAVYMRGIEWINIPTTLLSQVDSSVGGKTAVDLGTYKNIIGAFHLPKKVIVSTHFLMTLPPREWLCGVGEIVKTAFLDRAVSETVKNNLNELLTADEEITTKVVRECIEYKSSVVEKDFYETGLRKALNVGHTVGHALESVDGHERSHGEYVLLGMSAELFLLKGLVPEKSRNEFKYIDTVCGVLPIEFNAEEVARACLKDKKNGSGKISIMLPDYENTREVLFDYDEVVRGLEEWKSSQ